MPRGEFLGSLEHLVMLALVRLHANAYGMTILTFNLINYGTLPDAPERVLARWNPTEVYRQIGGTWKIVHSHWSFVQPELKQPTS